MYIVIPFMLIQNLTATTPFEGFSITKSLAVEILEIDQAYIHDS